MAGPNKRHAVTERKTTSSSGDSSGPSSSVTKSTKSIPRVDGNRDPDIITNTSRNPIDYSQLNDLKNISEALGYAGWCVARGLKIPDTLPQRPAKFNSYGKPINVTLNTFNVDDFPKHVVYQYDVSWGRETDSTKRVLVKKIWHSKAVKKALGEPQHLWIYDGNKLAWSGKKFDREETRIEVDLDEEENQDRVAKGMKPRANRDGNKHTLFVKYTRQLDFMALQHFLDGKSLYSTDCIDTINFLDHLMREAPGHRLTQIKKSFFDRGGIRTDLGGGVEAFKGVFSSLRPCLSDKLTKSLTVNVDVANGTFWRALPLQQSLEIAFNCPISTVGARFKEAQKDWKKSLFKKDLRRWKRVGVTAMHTDPPVQYTIDEFVDMDCHQATFKNVEGKKVSLYEYFRQKYGKALTINVPVVKMTKQIRQSPVYLPIDVLKIDSNQRYNTKLSDVQTSNMIKFAVTLPAVRWQAVMNGVKMLQWSEDAYLKHYGLRINPTPSKVKASLLPPPVSQFGQGSKDSTVQPRDLLQGRWRLDGRKFAITNTDKPIRSWGVCVIQGRGMINPTVTEKFAAEFTRIYEGHGGKVEAHPQFGKRPWIGPGHLTDGGEMVAKVFNACGDRYKMRPQLIFFVVCDRNVEVYRRIKKSMDIRFGCISQVVQSKHALTASAQYLSNVCMKVNAKLGGMTNVVRSNVIPKINPKAVQTPTMIVGADVSHPAPGAGSADAASYAAITMSIDATFTRYWAEVNTNGNRVEMITTANIQEHFAYMAKNWMHRLGKGQPPQRIIYIRDGVSEGQYAQVLNEEVADMRRVFEQLGCRTVPKFCVMIAGKRHHIRFFPDAGDKNKNPLPGTLVEAGCTHPHEFDFYLCSHVAIKGTARPIHYQCILNEGGLWQAAEIQQFLFEHSYQYVRSTTPVSMHPAVYYAHLAADRSRAHVTASPVSSGKKEQKQAEAKSSTSSSKKKKVEVPPLMRMPENSGLRQTMWYI